MRRYDDLQAGLKRVREELADERTAYKALSEQYNRLDLEHSDLRTLVLALPKVEGDFDVIARYRNENGSVHLNDEVKVLLKHRQGMEG